MMMASNSRRHRVQQTTNTFGNAAIASMNGKNYKKTMRTLQALMPREDGISKLQLMLQKVKCHIALGENEGAVTSCEEITSTLRRSTLDNQPTAAQIERFASEITLDAASFIKINLNVALPLQDSRFEFTKRFYKGNALLSNLVKIGKQMQLVADEMEAKNIANEFKQQYPLMDSILHLMQTTEVEDWKSKCVKLARFLMHYSYCCGVIHDHQKVIELLKQARHSMKTAYDKSGQATNRDAIAVLWVFIIGSLYLSFHDFDNVLYNVVFVLLFVFLLLLLFFHTK